MALNAAETEQAKEIVGQLVWQPAEGHNYRYARAVNTLTRYCEAASMEPDVARLVIEYLKNEVIDDGISLLNKRMDFGNGWKAMDAWYQTVAGEKFAGTESTKIRVFQVLMQPPADGSAGDGPYLVEDGCQYKVSHTFHWNVGELPELPESSSGIQYTMQGTTRDSTTGLYSCVIEKRERVRQDVPLYASRKSIYEEIAREEHIGVKASDLPNTGQAASAANGVLVERQVSKNPDCTSNVENTVTTEKGVTSSVVEKRRTIHGTVTSVTDRNQPAALGSDGLAVGETRRSEKTPGGLYNNTRQSHDVATVGKIAADCRKTIFEHEHQRQSLQRDAPSSDEVDAAGGGKIVRKTSRMTEEGGYEVTTSTTDEQAVPSTVVEKRRTLRGTVTSVTDRNQPAALGSDGLAVGETRRSEKTPGGLYNNTRQTLVPGSAVVGTATVSGGLVSSSSRTVLGGGAGGGRGGTNSVVETSTRIGDDGVQESTVRTTNYQPGSTSVGWNDVRGSHTYKSVRRSPSPPAVESEENASVTVSANVNDQGSYDYVVHKVKPRTSGKLADGESVSGSEHVHTTTKVVITGSAESPVAQPGTNKVQEVTVRQNADGGYEKTTRTTTYQPREADITWTTSEGSYRYHSFSNQPVKPSIPNGTRGQRVSASISMNERGSYDGSYTVFTPTDGGGGAASGEVLHSDGVIGYVWETREIGAFSRKRKVTVTYSHGVCAPSSAMDNIKGGQNYGPYKTHVSGLGGKIASWMKVTNVEFGEWESA